MAVGADCKKFVSNSSVPGQMMKDEGKQLHTVVLVVLSTSREYSYLLLTFTLAPHNSSTTNTVSSSSHYWEKA